MITKEQKENIVNVMIKTMEENNFLPWQKSWSCSMIPCNAITKRAYNGLNVLLLWCTGYNRMEFATYKQYAANDITVTPGEHGHKINFFKVCPVENKKKDGETEIINVPYLKQFYVFNVAQTNYSDDKENEMKKESTFDYKQIDDFISKLPVKIVYGKEPSYDMAHDVVNIPKFGDFESPEEYYSSLFHEIIHWSGSESRMNRKMTTLSMDKNSYSYEECIAEIGSAFLAAHFNLKSEKLAQSNAAYVKSWIGALKANPSILWTAAADAQKACDYIMKMV